VCTKNSGQNKYRDHSSRACSAMELLFDGNTLMHCIACFVCAPILLSLHTPPLFTRLPLQGKYSLSHRQVNVGRMAPTNRAWIRSRMAAIKKTSGIAFSEEIFLSILICLVAKNRHLVLHTSPEILPELKSVVEQVRHK
jgi:hypothetical protein